ncbi:hypothetical protein BH11CYA1_BH11CYA1_47700 [soil metagenome]
MHRAQEFDNGPDRHSCTEQEKSATGKSGTKKDSRSFPLRKGATVKILVKQELYVMRVA